MFGGGFKIEIRKLMIRHRCPIAADVQDCEPMLGQVAADEMVAVALGRVFFTAHDHRPLLAADLDQLVDPLKKKIAGHAGWDVAVADGVEGLSARGIIH